MTNEHAPLGIDVLEQSIQNEREELLQIHAMLKCLYEVLLYADDDDSVMHADVANVCARLLKDCVNRLEEMVVRFKAEAGSNG